MSLFMSTPSCVSLLKRHDTCFRLNWVNRILQIYKLRSKYNCHEVPKKVKDLRFINII